MPRDKYGQFYFHFFICDFPELGDVAIRNHEDALGTIRVVSGKKTDALFPDDFVPPDGAAKVFMVAGEGFAPDEYLKVRDAVLMQRDLVPPEIWEELFGTKGAETPVPPQNEANPAERKRANRKPKTGKRGGGRKKKLSAEDETALARLWTNDKIVNPDDGNRERAKRLEATDKLFTEKPYLKGRLAYQTGRETRYLTRGLAHLDEPDP